MNLTKIYGKVFTSKSVRTGPSSCEKRIYLAAVSQSLSNTALQHLSHSTTNQSQPFSPALLCVKCEKENDVPHNATKETHRCYVSELVMFLYVAMSV